jgi:RNA polymerase sigma-70 factor (ECF subfamily)
MSEDETNAPAGRLDDLRRQMIGLAVKFVWNRDDAEELVQDAFKISVRGGPGTDEERFGPWMVRTVTNLCLNHRRKRRTEPLQEWMGPLTEGGPAEAMEQAERLELLRASIDQLPRQQRALGHAGDAAR